MTFEVCANSLAQVAANLNNALAERRSREKLNKALHAFTMHRDFDKVPLEELIGLLEKNGFRSDELKSTDVSVSSGEAHVQIGPRTVFYITWIRCDETAPYKVVAYAS